MATYNVNKYTVETILSSIKSGNIAILEMQRPSVWEAWNIFEEKYV